MTRGEPFEVSKEVFDRCHNGYMDDADEKELFSEAIRWGYGLYDCKVHEENGKYICTWERGDSCD